MPSVSAVMMSVGLAALGAWECEAAGGTVVEHVFFPFFAAALP